GDFATLNGFLYFSARTAMEGRELWKTNITTTSILKDIVTGTDSSNNMDEYNLFSNGTYLLFAARTAASGVELWKSNGTTAGTVMLTEINTGSANADSSNPKDFFALNSVILFTANDGTHGDEFWRTDGTPAGTSMLKDINPGTASSADLNFNVFHPFNNRAYFTAYDGISTGEIWSTDGSPGSATLLKDVVPGTLSSGINLFDAISLPTKFIFPVSNFVTTSELWESDGTPTGTKVFKSFAVNPGAFLQILLPYTFNFTSGTITYPLFQGNKFFFNASTIAAGSELWVSDGTLAGTSMVKDINPGTGDGFNLSGFYVYTTSALFFSGNDGATGNELWKSDGTVSPTGTSIVANISPGANDADPQLPFFICNGKVIFSADNGDNAINNPVLTDLYVVSGNFTPLPIELVDFTVTKVSNDAILYGVYKYYKTL
ncbi:MAG: ELWxxDGT repeat protein, partial [Ferruginibacter sp.]